MRLLCCHNRYQIRSGEDVAFDTAVALWRRAGHEVRVFERDNAEMLERRAASRWRAARRAVFDPDVYADVSAVVADWRPQAAIIQNTFPLISFAAHEALAHRGVPVIQVLYNYRYLCLNGELYTGGQICERCAGGNYLHGVARRCYRGGFGTSAVAARVAFANRRDGIWRRTVQRFVAPDRFLQDKLVAWGLPQERFRVIPNPMEPPTAAYRPGHNGTALYLGRWSRAKGVLTLLSAMLEADLPALLMVGGGEERAAMERHEAVTSGRVTLIGPEYGDALARRMAEVMAVIVPSEWYDNLPMVVTQAFALGRPVIASRINGIPEYVRPGVNGVLVAPGDARGLAEAMREVRDDPRLWATLSAGARRTAAEEFAEPVWAARWQGVFDELVA
ncbi:MAG: glycosyltransferase [Gemmatimonadetes bacterium]|nr:glycosyltransferase [Gemmatimonadota bacterium]